MVMLEQVSGGLACCVDVDGCIKRGISLDRGQVFSNGGGVTQRY